VVSTRVTIPDFLRLVELAGAQSKVGTYLGRLIREKLSTPTDAHAGETEEP
jgi:hypothetical protein